MIKNIIFDFGNVLLNLDESASYTELIKLLDPEKSGDLEKSVFHPFEKGEISEDSFLNRLQRRSQQIYPAELYIKAWNAMLGDFPPIREKFLIDLRKNYKLYLLSNTNILHLRYVKNTLATENGIVDFDSLFFEKTYYSFEMGMRKPDAEIFEFVLNDSGLNAQETLFIDDKIENIESAIRLEILAYHHDPSQEISEVLYKLLHIMNQ